MPKKPKITAQRAPSKLLLSKWERQKNMQRLVMLAGGLIIVVIFGLLSFGYYDFKIKPALADKSALAQAAFSINDKVYTKDRLYKTLLLQAARQGDPNKQNLSQLSRDIVVYLQDLEIAAQEAEKLGIKVSQEEIARELPDWNDWGFSEAEVKEWRRQELLKDRLKKEHIDSQVPAEEMQVQVERVLLRTREDAESVARQLKEGASFAAVKELSQDPASKEKDGNTGWISREQLGKSFDEVAFSLKKNEVSQPFFDEGATVKGGYWLIRLTGREGENIKAHGILLRTEGEAKEAKERLDKGEIFTDLAEELSQDFFADQTSGDLGTISKGQYSPEFDQVAFNLGPGQVGGPVFDPNRSLRGGHWVVKAVEEPQMRVLEKVALESRQAQFFRKWLDEKKSDYRIENKLDPDQENWLTTKVRQELDARNKARQKR